MLLVGHLTKSEVKHIAEAAGLPDVLRTKRSSSGICFIGKRSFGQFLENYIPPKPGVYVDVDSGKTLGRCHNLLAVTVGQRAIGLGGQEDRVYVVGKDLARDVVHVAAGHDHPALYSSRVLLLNPSWIASEAPAVLLSKGAAAAGDPGPGCSLDTSSEREHQSEQHVADESTNSRDVLDCDYKARYRQPSAPCIITKLQDAFASSNFCQGVSAASSSKPQQQLLVADLDAPLRGLTPGQMFVMYSGDVCLGSAMIAAHGPTQFEVQ